MDVRALREWGSVSFVSRTRLAGWWRCRAWGRSAAGGGESLHCLGWEREVSGLAGPVIWVMQTMGCRGCLPGFSGSPQRLMFAERY